MSLLLSAVRHMFRQTPWQAFQATLSADMQLCCCEFAEANASCLHRHTAKQQVPLGLGDMHMIGALAA